ncbi:MAG: NfeD family protein [Ardenticatenaceae bacterium]|nr:NfeD family protein [Ardenticatenaceae bacterium]HBY94695.1 hypothetical protein [Chloroflexota bacterium]
MTAGVWSALDIVFAAALVFGVGWALIAFLGGEFGGHSIEAHDAGIGLHHELDLHGGDHHELAGHNNFDGSVHVSPLSPTIVATGLGGFGGFGLLASLVIGLGTLASTLFALGGGVLFGLVMYLFYGGLLAGAQGSSEIRLESLYGTTGTVITAIPANSVGEIAFVAQGTRVTTIARSATGQPIPRGQLVIIQEMSGPIAIVRETR